MIAAYGYLLENVKIISPDDNLYCLANFLDSCGAVCLSAYSRDLYYYEDLMSARAIS